MKIVTKKKCLHMNISTNISVHRIFQSENSLDFAMQRKENLEEIINFMEVIYVE